MADKHKTWNMNPDNLDLELCFSQCVKLPLCPHSYRLEFTTPNFLFSFHLFHWITGVPATVVVYQVYK